MLKLKLILFSIIVSGSLMSCSKGDTSLSASVTASTSILIPASTWSCKVIKANTVTADTIDVTAKYFQVKNFKLSWTNTSANLYIVLIKLEPKSSLVSFTGVIAGDELTALYGGGTTGNTAWGGYIKRASSSTSPSTVTMDCPITVGGVSVSKDNDKDFVAPVTVTVIGVQRPVDSSGNETGEEVPVSITTSINVQNVANTNIN